jgi:hypothetical protein
MPAPETPVPERPAPPGDEAAVAAAYGSPAAPPPRARTASSAPTQPADAASAQTSALAPAPVTVDGVRRVHVSEDWLATGVGLSIVALGLLGLIPEGLVP